MRLNMIILLSRSHFGVYGIYAHGLRMLDDDIEDIMYPGKDYYGWQYRRFIAVLLQMFMSLRIVLILISMCRMGDAELVVYVQ